MSGQLAPRLARGRTVPADRAPLPVPESSLTPLYWYVKPAIALSLYPGSF